MTYTVTLSHKLSRDGVMVPAGSIVPDMSQCELDGLRRDRERSDAAIPNEQRQDVSRTAQRTPTKKSDSAVSESAAIPTATETQHDIPNS